MSGFIYVLSNAAMPGLVKVGRTDRIPNQRAIELHTTGVPLPFKIEFAMWFTDPESIERDIHEELIDSRVSFSREFFRVEAVDVARRLAEMGLDSMGCHAFAVRFFDEVIDEADLLRYASICGSSPFDIRQIIDMLTSDEWLAAKDRLTERRKERQAKLHSQNGCDA